MKRWAIRITVLLACGAIVNIAVAWGCAMWIRFDSTVYFDGKDGGVLEREQHYQHWLVHRDERAGACLIASQWADKDLHIDLSGGWPESRPEVLIPGWAWFVRPPVTSISRGAWHYRWIDARGWPALTGWTGIACGTTVMLLWNLCGSQGA